MPNYSVASSAKSVTAGWRIHPDLHLSKYTSSDLSTSINLSLRQNTFSKPKVLDPPAFYGPTRQCCSEITSESSDLFMFTPPTTLTLPAFSSATTQILNRVPDSVSRGDDGVATLYTRQRSSRPRASGVVIPVYTKSSRLGFGI